MSRSSLTDRIQWLVARISNLANDFMGHSLLFKVGSVAYTLQLPQDSKIHPTSHVSQLRRFRGTPPTSVPQIPTTANGLHPVLQPSSILSSRRVLQKGKTLHQVLVQWTGCQLEDATWEDFAELCVLYPDLHLEDKVEFDGEGGDITAKVSRRSRKMPAWMEDYVA